MAAEIAISEVRIRFRKGEPGPLVGWASCVVNAAILLDNIEIRRGSKGDLFLSCPAKRSRGGIEHPYFCPISREARAALQEAILGKLSGRAGPNANGGPT